MRPANAVCLVGTLLGSAIAFAQEDSKEFFEKRIRPVLAEKCFSCHAASKLGGLRLDSRAALLEGGKSGPAIVPGQPDASRLIRAVNHADPKLKMPMAGDKLSAREIADLTAWVKAGSPWPEAAAKPPSGKGFTITPEQRAFWSFQPIRKPTPPAVKDAVWVKTPIDRFILAKIEENGLRPAKLAEKRTLLRRASFDLTGLPPTPEQIKAFLADASPDAFSKAVDRLLASPHYGERWARHWLDVARYADGDGPDRRPVFIGYGMAKDGHVNTWRYRDWVIDALNRDLPYDQFVRAQIAADLLPEKRPGLLPGLGFFGLGPWFTGDDVVFAEARANERDDKIDTLSKGFLGLTVACARCHDHKYDPISQKDYYALAGVFWSSGYYEHNLAPEGEVSRYKEHWAKIKAKEAEIKQYGVDLRLFVESSLAAQSSRFMMAGRKILLSTPKLDAAHVAAEERLDLETLQRWLKYLPAKQREHPYLAQWDRLMAAGGGTDAEAQALAEDFQKLVLSIISDKKAVEKANEELRSNYKPDPNEARVSLPGDLMQFELFQFKQSLVQKVVDTKRFYVWLDIVHGDPESINISRKKAVSEYDGKELLRFLTAEQKGKLDALQAELEALNKQAPSEYPYLMGLADAPAPANLKLHIRGNPHVLGEEVPRGMPAILGNSGSEPIPFTKGSGRLDLAESIVRHPLAARVMANRIWMHHFGRGIVATPSNFGVTGERPTHPELLDHLASRFVERNWSMKALHREIMLSAAYQLSYATIEANETVDPSNRLLWRANLRRLDAESLRDALLFAAGTLDERAGGPPEDLGSLNSKKRTVYGRIRRGGPDRALLLFDFPDPSVSGEQRSVTNVPLQGLFFLNSEFVGRQAELLAKRVDGAPDDAARVQQAYRLVFGRPARDAELKRALEFIGKAKDPKTAWERYAQALLSSGEFYYVN